MIASHQGNKEFENGITDDKSPQLSTASVVYELAGNEARIGCFLQRYRQFTGRQHQREITFIH